MISIDFSLIFIDFGLPNGSPESPGVTRSHFPILRLLGALGGWSGELSGTPECGQYYKGLDPAGGDLTAGGSEVDFPRAKGQDDVSITRKLPQTSSKPPQ